MEENQQSITKSGGEKVLEGLDSLESRIPMAFSAHQQVTKFQTEVLQVHMELKMMLSEFQDQSRTRYNIEKELLDHKEAYKKAIQKIDDLVLAKNSYDDIVATQTTDTS